MSVLLRISTRGSPLALWQTRTVESAIRSAVPGADLERIICRTAGDKDRERPLAELGQVGLFTAEVNRVLLRGKAQLAVHSLKDCPSEIEDGLVLAAVLSREVPLDAFVPGDDAMSFNALPGGAAVATGSLRRRAQILAARPDLVVRELRGNIDTRLRKRKEDGNHAVIVAEAALRRLEKNVSREVLPAEVMLPAVAQGIVGIYAREEDSETREILASISHEKTMIAALAERGMLAVLQGGCRVPAGALAAVTGVSVRIVGLVASLDGTRIVRGEEAGPAAEAETIGRRLGESLLSDGGAEILAEIRSGEDG